MARTRSIKPGFFKNEILCSLPCQDRLLFAGLWTIADREGRLEDRPRRIHIELFPYDSEFDIEGSLARLHHAKFINRYQVDGNKYIEIPKWKQHQAPHFKEVQSLIQTTTQVGASPGFMNNPAAPSTLIPSTLIPLNGEFVRPEFDEQWQDFRSQYEATGKPLIEGDWSSANYCWRVLDHFQRTEALAGISARLEAHQWDDPNFIPKPENYLKGEYRRKVIPRMNGTGGKKDIAQVMLEEMRAKREAE